ncbi:hypothetical protein D9M68_455270 [compost metagenome]
MTKKLSEKKSNLFEEIKQIDQHGNEYWRARDLSKALEYSEYRHFMPAIVRAKEACANSGQKITDHFEDVLGMVTIGSGAKRRASDVNLSRFACYLIVQNADPAKETVAMGQMYFAVQTRLQEISQMDAFNQLHTENEKRLFLRNELTKHNIQLATTARGAGVINPVDYAIFQNPGYKGLYGGLDAKAIHQKKGLKKRQHILDHMGSTELAANLFRATQAEEKLRREQIKGKQQANQAHFEVGKKVRKTIHELGGEMPENLSAAESIKQLETRKRPLKNIKK